MFLERNFLLVQTMATDGAAFLSCSDFSSIHPWYLDYCYCWAELLPLRPITLSHFGLWQ